MLIGGCVSLGRSPGYVNMVTYIHFTDAVWVGVMGIFYVWPWYSMRSKEDWWVTVTYGRGFVIVDEAAMWFVVVCFGEGHMKIAIEGGSKEGRMVVSLCMIWTSVLVGLRVLVSGGVSVFIEG